MFWKKKKGMIDVGEMHRRGMVIAPKQDPNVEKFRMSKEGYVEMRDESKNAPQEEKTGGGFASFFGFDSNSNETSSVSNSSPGIMDLPGTGESGMFSNSSVAQISNQDVYEKREVDEKVEKLDSLIYKLEQRIEFLERKLGMNSNL